MNWCSVRSSMPRLGVLVETLRGEIISVEMLDWNDIWTRDNEQGLEPVTAWRRLSFSDGTEKIKRSERKKMKKKLSGYVIRRELVAGNIQRAALAVITVGLFLASKLHGTAAIVVTVVCMAAAAGIVAECFIRVGRLAEPADTQKDERPQTRSVNVETVVIPEEYYATAKKKPAQRGRRKTK